MAKLNKKFQKAKREEMFKKMVSQINKSISCAFTVQHMYNIHNSWIVRLEREYIQDSDKSESIAEIHFRWMLKFEKVERMILGAKILSKVNLESHDQ